jgi:hypothetical protein
VWPAGVLSQYPGTLVCGACLQQRTNLLKGRNDYGQLGLGNTQGRGSSPADFPLPFAILGGEAALQVVTGASRNPKK